MKRVSSNSGMLLPSISRRSRRPRLDMLTRLATMGCRDERGAGSKVLPKTHQIAQGKFYSYILEPEVGITYRRIIKIIVVIIIKVLTVVMAIIL